MTHRITTVRDLLHPRRPEARADLFELRRLEHRLVRRIDDLDARVEAVLALDGFPTEEHIGAVDVLCAAIAEAQELLDDARREATVHVERRRRRRLRPRRWA